MVKAKHTNGNYKELSFRKLILCSMKWTYWYCLHEDLGFQAKPSRPCIKRSCIKSHILLRWHFEYPELTWTIFLTVILDSV
jgi:hypothetical protein